MMVRKDLFYRLHRKDAEKPCPRTVTDATVISRGRVFQRPAPAIHLVIATIPIIPAPATIPVTDDQYEMNEKKTIYTRFKIFYEHWLAYVHRNIWQ